MTTTDPLDLEGACLALVAACDRAQISRSSLFLRYIGLGGIGSSREVADHCAGGPFLPVLEHNMLVQAVNERFLEVEDQHRVPYLQVS